LEKLLVKSWRVPLSNLAILNEEELIDIVDQMRTSIPRQVRKAEQVHNDRERLLREAEQEAERLVSQAQTKAEVLVSREEIVKAAETRSNTILKRAEDDAQRMRVEADDYARRVLLKLDSQLAALGVEVNRVSSTVRNGIEALASGGSPVPPDEG
jgi:cell division septum initiation protein DivIVA